VLFSDLFEKEVTLSGRFGSRDGREESKAKAKRGLLEGLDVGKRNRILGSTKENLTTMYGSPSPSKCLVTFCLLSQI
jgi:hypothetical protein